MILVSMLAASLGAGAAAQQARYDDVVRNLRNPEPRIRLNAVRLLREAKHPEAIVPMAPLVNDALDPIQLEAIAAELSFFLVQDVPEMGFLVEVRNRGGAPTAFDLGPLAVWPRQAPPELIANLLKAVDDDNPRVRLEAMYAVGVVGRGPLAAIREAAARVAGRLAVKATADALIKAVNDSNANVRYAAMRSLGMLREERAVNALTEQLKFYGKGEGAWSALDALARIAHASSVPVFTERLADRDQYMRRAAAEGLGRAGDKAAVGALETGAGTDPSSTVRAAMQYALQKLGRNYIGRLIEFLDEPKVTLQVQEYLIEFGPAIEKELLPSLQEPDEGIRAAVADVLGEIGGDASLAALQSHSDRSKDVVEAAKRAVDRIGMRRAR
jgi:HEAT repeat protein